MQQNGEKLNTMKTSLFSILLTGHDSPKLDAFPEKIRQNFSSLAAEHPFGEHRIYQDEELRSFIAERFGPEVVSSYDQLVPLAYRADLGRYCLLYEHGGIYSDVSNFFFAPVCDGPPHRLHVFRDNFSQVPWLVNNALIAAPAHADVFRHTIEAICHHVRTRYYGINALSPTGPNLFGQMLALHSDQIELANGRVVVINGESQRYESFAFVSKDGELIAVRRKTSPGLESLGMKTDSGYAECYARQGIYLTAPPTPRTGSAPPGASRYRLARVLGGLARGDADYWERVRLLLGGRHRARHETPPDPTQT